MGGRRSRRVAGAIIILFGAVTFLVGQASAASAANDSAANDSAANDSVASAAGDGKVFVVNALAGVTARMAVDGSVIQASAGPKSVVGPLRLPPGQHVLELRVGPSVMVSARFSVAGGDSLDVVAHRAADLARTPLITVFRNDLAAVRPGKTRLVVSQVAVAEPADVRLDGKPYFRNLANAESFSVVVPARSYALDVVPTAAPDRAILAPVQVSLSAGTLTRVFVVGSPDDATTDEVVQVLPVPVVGAGTPSSVHTGDGGQAAEGFVTSPARLGGLVAMVAVGLGLAGFVTIRRGVVRRGAVREVRVNGSPLRS